MNCKIEYKLKQETPMIHFQWDEVGACLRASEVKPKLDKFIIEDMGGKEKIKNDIAKNGPQSEYFDIFVHTPKDINGEYQIEKWALNYKLKINHKGKIETQNSGDLGPYFAGNMQGGIKKSLFCKGDIEFTIICFIEKIQSVINEPDKIESFFLLNNFGTRQNRGLGCFSLSNYDSNKHSNLFKDKNVYKIDYSNVSGADYNMILHDGNLLYQFLKSGMNFGKTYVKSFLTYYCSENKIVGEKAVLKANGISPAVYKSKNEKFKPKNPNTNKAGFYIRALLGMAESIEYIDDLEKNDNDIEVPRKVKGKIVKDTVSISSETIQRIPSPIRYSIHNNVLYIILEEIDTSIYGEKVTFKVKTDCDSNFKPERESKDIWIPSKGQIDLSDLIEQYVKYVNKDTEFATKMKNRNDNLKEKDKMKEVFYVKEKNLKIEKV